MRIRTRLPGKFCQLNGFTRGIRTRAGDHRDTPGHMFYRGFDQQAMFSHIDRGRFARCADHHNPVRTFRNMPIEQAF